MEMYIWNTVIVVTKLMFYLGFAATAGYTFFWRDINDSRTSYTTPSYSAVWVKVCVFVAFISNAVWFIANTGAMVEEGIQGALDPFMLKIMLSSPIGEVTLYRAGGLAVALITIYLLKFKPLKPFLRLKSCLLVLCLFTLSYTFTLTGHVSELGSIARILLMVHVFVMAWWFGALIPLKLSCHYQSYEKLYKLMDRFGTQATVLVTLLLSAGIWLAIQLVGSFEGLFSSIYGQTLLVKMFLVTSILAIAIRHKLKLVPKLKSGSGSEALSKSISLELTIAVAILIITSGLTSIVGPER